MNKKKKYNSPLIERIDIDKSISLVMLSEHTGVDPGGPFGPGGGGNPSPSGGNNFSGSKIEKKDSPSTFEQNPFK